MSTGSALVLVALSVWLLLLIAALPLAYGAGLAARGRGCCWWTWGRRADSPCRPCRWAVPHPVGVASLVLLATQVAHVAGPQGVSLRATLPEYSVGWLIRCGLLGLSACALVLGHHVRADRRAERAPLQNFLPPSVSPPLVSPPGLPCAAALLLVLGRAAMRQHTFRCRALTCGRCGLPPPIASDPPVSGAGLGPWQLTWLWKGAQAEPAQALIDLLLHQATARRPPCVVVLQPKPSGMFIAPGPQSEIAPKGGGQGGQTLKPDPDPWVTRGAVPDCRASQVGGAEGAL